MSLSRARTAWADALSQANVAGQAKMLAPETFAASLTRYEFGKTTLNLWGVGACELRRTQRDCAGYSRNSYSLCLVTKGEFHVGEAGRQTLVNKGECFLISPMEPGFVSNQDSASFTSLHLPHDWVKNWLPCPQDATAISFSKHSNWGHALAATMAALTPVSLDAMAVAPHIVIDQINCLLALAMGPEQSPAGEYHSRMLKRFHEAIREHLHDPNFCPATLAFEQSISKRTVHSIFARAGTSFGVELLSCRMKHARQLLDNSKFDKKPIAEIARLVGFVHAGHFITRFRVAYGVTPFVYRSIRCS